MDDGFGARRNGESAGASPTKGCVWLFHPHCGPLFEPFWPNGMNTKGLPLFHLEPATSLGATTNGDEVDVVVDVPWLARLDMPLACGGRWVAKAAQKRFE